MPTGIPTMSDAPLRYCPACGADGFRRAAEKDWRCPTCAFRLFLNAAAAVALLLECRGEVLLTVRAHEPGRGLLDLPGGFLDAGETYEDGVRREVREELGIELGEIRYRFSYPNRYPFAGVIYDTADVFFSAEVGEKPDLRPADDVAGVLWVPRIAPPLERVSGASIRRALERNAREGRP